MEIIEKEKHVEVTEVYNGHPYKSKHKKFLCIGGPYNGQRKASVQITEEDYVGFNCAEMGRRRRKDPLKDLTKIFVHKSALEQDIHGSVDI